MSSQLPYLPPLNRTLDDVKSIAVGAADDVRNTTGNAAKAGVALRAGLALVPAAVRAASDTAAIPANAVMSQVGPFVKGLFTGAPSAQPSGPTLNLPAIANPQGANLNGLPAGVTRIGPDGRPLAPADYDKVPFAGPATQAPVATPTNTTPLTVTRDGNKVSITGDQPSGPPATQSLPVMYRPDPVAIGIQRQAAYADQQRAAVLDAASAAAASGNPGNASYRYAAALHGLPSLSGTNSFASTEANLQAERERTAEAEQANIRTTEASRYNTDVQASALKRNVQVTKIGEIINPDPVTRPFAPKIDQYGMVIPDPKSPTGFRVYDMQGNEQKPPAAAAPIVGSRTSQKDGSYKHGDKTVTIKGGVITEVK